VEDGGDISSKTAVGVAASHDINGSKCGQFFFCEQARPFIPVDFFLVSHTMLHCILCCPMIQELYSEREGMVPLVGVVLPIRLMHIVILGIVLLKMPLPIYYAA
jgi:hypothetical protein